MKRFTSYFEKSEPQPGYTEGDYSQGTVFILSENWNEFPKGSEFTLSEGELPDICKQLGNGITRALFKAPDGKFIQITGSKLLLETIFIHKPKSIQESLESAPIQPVVIVEKEIVQTLPPEIPVDTIRQIVQEMVVAGPKGEQGPAGPPGKTIIIEKPQESVSTSATSTEFDFGTIEKESAPGLSIDLGSL